MNSKKGKSFLSELNSKINKISKTFLLLICVVYALVLGCIVTITVVEQDYTIVPSYEHVYFNEDINSQITLIPVRTFDDDGNMTLKYTVRVYVYGRISSSSTADPGYTIKNLKVSASTVSKVSNKKTDKMYYFTEYNSYTTPVQHSYTIDNSSIDQHPYAFYTQLQYRKGGKNIIATFKENVLLQPDSTDITSIDSYYAANSEVANLSAITFNDQENNALGTLQFIATDDTEDGVYTMGTKITMNTLNYSSRHHIDMQSWIETSDSVRKFLPFIGVYSYSSQKSNYIQSGWDVDKQLNPKYICAKLTYYFSETEYAEYYFKQEISKLTSEFTTSPVTGDNDYSVEDTVKNNNVLVYVGIGAGIGIIAITATVSIVYVIKTKTKKETENTEETNKNNEN